MTPRAAAPLPLMTTAQLATYLGKTEAAIHAMRYRGECPPAVKVGQQLRFRPEDVDAWLAERAA